MSGFFLFYQIDHQRDDFELLAESVLEHASACLEEELRAEERLNQNFVFIYP